MRKWTAVVASLLVLGFAGALFAQGMNMNGTPRYGTANLQSGFVPDPNVTNVMAGGSDDASSMGISDSVSNEGARGYVAAATPDVRLNWGGGTFYIFVECDDDTTLVVNDAGSGWRCNDDSDGLNPCLAFQNGAAGQYDVWVGTFNNQQPVSARLCVTEFDPGSD